MDLWMDLRSAVDEANELEKYFLLKQLLKVQSRNRYNLFVNHKGEVTDMGMILGAAVELLWHDLNRIVDRKPQISAEKNGGGGID